MALKRWFGGSASERSRAATKKQAAIHVNQMCMRAIKRGAAVIHANFKKSKVF
jgi:hypothetical protein